MQRAADAEGVRGRDYFDEDRATSDAFRHFPRFWENWLELATWKRLSESETTGIDWRTADGTKDDCIWATVPSTTQPSQYDFGVLLAICPITVYEAIIKSGVAEKQYGHLPRLALSILGSHTSNAVSESCHSIAQNVMSDMQTNMGEDILQKIVALRDSKTAIEKLKAIFPEEAKNVSHDIKKRLGEIALQHRASGNDTKIAAKPESSSSDPCSSSDEDEPENDEPEN